MHIAIATIDVINSSALSATELKKVMERLGAEVNELKRQKRISYFEMFRGDSMQLIIPAPEEALEIAFTLKAAVNSIHSSGAGKRGHKMFSDIRIAIGLGRSKQSEFNKMTNETPFVRSGRKLDEIHRENLGMGISTGNPRSDSELYTELYIYEGIHKRWTRLVAEVVYHKLKGKTEQVIAAELTISQSAVNQRSQSAYWNGLAVLLKRYRELLTEEQYE